MKQITHLQLTWKELDTLIENIVTSFEQSQLIDSSTIDSIYGIPRGGLIPAVILSHRLGLELVNDPVGSTLVVDDIADSGKTLQRYQNPTAVLITRLHTTSVMPTITGTYLEDDRWVIFPWESQYSETFPGYKDPRSLLTYWQVSALSQSQLGELVRRVDEYVRRELGGVEPATNELRSLTQAIASNILAVKEDLGRQI